MPGKNLTGTTPEQLRYKIIESAAYLYTGDREGFNMKQIAKNADVEISDIYDNFSDKYAIIRSYYGTIVPRYRAMISDIDEYKDFTAGEKISNFIYTSFDMLNEERAFVKATFDRLVMVPWDRTNYHRQADDLILDVLNDERIPVSNRIYLNPATVKFVTVSYFNIIRLWLSDNSADSEKTLALVDKLTSFFDDIVYNTTMEKGFDLIRYVYENKLLMPGFNGVKEFADQFMQKYNAFKSHRSNG